MKIKNRKSRGITSKNKSTGRSKKKTKVGPTGRLRSSWDTTKSAKFNYEQLGIAQDPDKQPSKPFQKEVFNDLVTNTDYVPTASAIQDWQREILAVLIKRHGSDHKAMSKDIKINTWQWTKTQIKRMIELM
jgi:Ribosome biogenesis protein Nop16